MTFDATTSLALFTNAWDSPFVVPVAGCFMILGIVVSGIWSSVRTREMQGQERLAAIAKGLPIPPTIEELAIIHGKPNEDRARRKRGNARQAGIILISASIGLMVFFFALTVILRQREVLSGMAVSLIPLGIGVGLLIDANIQKKELALLNESNPKPPSY